MLHALPGLLAVEVELQRKSASRMVGIASMYRAWISEGAIAGMLYVCANARLADHVHAHGVKAGIPHGHGLWIELLDDIREQARGGTRRPPAGRAKLVRWQPCRTGPPPEPLIGRIAVCRLLLRGRVGERVESPHESVIRRRLRMFADRGLPPAL